MKFSSLNCSIQHDSILARFTSLFWLFFLLNSRKDERSFSKPMKSGLPKKNSCKVTSIISGGPSYYNNNNIIILIRLTIKDIFPNEELFRENRVFLHCSFKILVNLIIIILKFVWKLYVGNWNVKVEFEIVERKHS